MIELTDHELQLLTTVEGIPAATMAKLRASRDADVPPLSVAEHAEVLEAVGDELGVTGFDLDYEPTERGAALEALIDKLNEE